MIYAMAILYTYMIGSKAIGLIMSSEMLKLKLRKLCASAIYWFKDCGALFIIFIIYHG